MPPMSAARLNTCSHPWATFRQLSNTRRSTRWNSSQKISSCGKAGGGKKVKRERSGQGSRRRQRCGDLLGAAARHGGCCRCCHSPAAPSGGTLLTLLPGCSPTARLSHNRQADAAAAAVAARPATLHWPCMLTGMCSLRFQSAGRGQPGKQIGCKAAMCVPAGHTASERGCESAVRRLCLTAAHNVVALGLQPLGQVTAAVGDGGWTVVCGAPPHLATAPDAGAPSSRRCRPHLAMKPPAPVMHIRSFFWGQ